MRTYPLYIFILAGLLLWSCQKDMDSDFIKEEPRFVIYGLFYPTDVVDPENAAYHHFYGIPLEVSRSAKVYEEDEPEEITDAELAVFENGTYLGPVLPPGKEVLFDTIEFYRRQYVTRETFRSGKTYEIRARHPDLEEASVSFVMPSRVAIESAVIDTRTNELSFNFNDALGADFYSYSFTVLDSSDNNTFQTHVRFEPKDQNTEFFLYQEFDSVFIPRADKLERSGYMGYLSDRHFDGEVKEIKITLPNRDLSSDSVHVIVHLNHITPALYHYQRSSWAYGRTEGNPLAESVQLHTNVENGYGMVGASVTYRKTAVKK